TAATTHAARQRARTPHAQGAHDDGQTRLIRDRVPDVAVPIPRSAAGPERTHHRNPAQPPVGTNARTQQEREGRTMTGASWLVAWLALLLALFGIAATISPPRGD